MAPTPPDPHVRNRKPLLALIVVLIVVVGGLVVVFNNKPGAGMGGSLTGSPTRSR